MKSFLYCSYRANGYIIWEDISTITRRRWVVVQTDIASMVNKHRSVHPLFDPRDGDFEGRAKNLQEFIGNNIDKLL